MCSQGQRSKLMHTGFVCAWKAVKRFFKVSSLSSARWIRGSPVMSSLPSVCLHPRRRKTLSTLQTEYRNRLLKICKTKDLFIYLSIYPFIYLYTYTHTHVPREREEKKTVRGSSNLWGVELAMIGSPARWMNQTTCYALNQSFIWYLEIQDTIYLRPFLRKHVI